QAMLRDNRLSSRIRTDSENERSRSWMPPVLLYMDPPAHTELRAHVRPAMEKSYIAALEPVIAERVRELVSSLTTRDTDLIESVAYPLPVTVIGRLLGLPPDDWGMLMEKGAAITSILDWRPKADASVAANQVALRMVPYFMRLLRSKRSLPDD